MPDLDGRAHLGIVEDRCSATTVMVVGPDSRAHQKPVKTGVKQGDDVQVTEGLQEGEKAVTSGAYGLPDNTKVKIESPKAPAGEEKPGAGKEGGQKEGDTDEK